MGFKNKAPDAGYAAWLDTLPKRRVTWFARGEHNRLVVTLRDGGRVIGLPIINGGKGQHENTPYYPIPFSPGLLAGVADGEFPQLLPRVTMADGSRLAPLAYARNVKVIEKGRRTIVTYEQAVLDKLGADAPIADDRLSVKTTYVLEPGKISRTDVFTPEGAQDIRAVDLSFASFSAAPSTKGGVTTYGRGEVRGFRATGLGCKSRPLRDEEAYRTPTGAFESLVECAGGARTLSEPLTVSWSLTYR